MVEEELFDEENEGVLVDDNDTSADGHVEFAIIGTIPTV